jgi:hypothetical protein
LAAEDIGGTPNFVAGALLERARAATDIVVIFRLAGRVGKLPLREDAIYLL